MWSKASSTDALYIELAEQLGATLLTTDAVLAGTTDLSELVASRLQVDDRTRA